MTALTLESRIQNNVVDLYNYQKFTSTNNGKLTGKALLSNKIKNLSIIDVDINKSLNNEENLQD